MEIDWTWLTWFVPLALGAGLTFFFGWLDSTIKYRRERREQSIADARELAERKRVESREHALAALNLASRVRDRVDPGPRNIADLIDPARESAAEWDPDEIRELQDLGVLIPDPTIRRLIADATNLVTAAGTAAEACDWAETAREIQTGSMRRLREALGAYIRIEVFDPRGLAWFDAHAKRQKDAWDELERMAAERRQVMGSDHPA